MIMAASAFPADQPVARIRAPCVAVHSRPSRGRQSRLLMAPQFEFAMGDVGKWLIHRHKLNCGARAHLPKPRRPC